MMGYYIGAVKTRLGWAGFLWSKDGLAANTLFHSTIRSALAEIESRSKIAAEDKAPPEWIEKFFNVYAEGDFAEAARISKRSAKFDFASGTPFQKSVWREIFKIPCGKTKSYGDIAAALGTSARPVGGACGKNPCPVVIPCHRVLAADGGLGGFYGGVELKKRLLKHEGYPV